jgi:predicted HD phosphohydrolase
MDRDAREQYRGHPHFEACAEFCETYDQSAFDPAYESAPLSFFEPIVQRVMAKPLPRAWQS